jgi:hypothetical protein
VHGTPLFAICAYVCRRCVRTLGWTRLNGVGGLELGMAMGGCGSGVANSHPHPHMSKKFTPAPIMLTGGFSHPHPHPRVTRRVPGARWV